MEDVLGFGRILPIDKLIETVSSVVGRLSKPYFDKKDIDTKAYEIKKLAEARAEEMRIMSNAIKDNFLITGGIGYKENGIEITSPKELPSSNNLEDLSVPSIEERAQHRVSLKEAKKQLNLESITAYAADQLKDEPPVSDEPIDDDWKTRFFNIAEEVSSQEMQALWGRILAGEIKKPKSFSLRTLELLRNLNKEEAECFMKFGQFAISSYGLCFTLNFYKGENQLKDKYGLNYQDRLLLEELGLIAANDLQFVLNETKDTATQSVLQTGDICIVVNKNANLPRQVVDALIFTKIGQELLQLIKTKPDFDYIKIFASKLRTNGVIIKFATIIEIKDGLISHNGLIDIPEI